MTRLLTEVSPSMLVKREGVNYGRLKPLIGASAQSRLIVGGGGPRLLHHNNTADLQRNLC